MPWERIPEAFFAGVLPMLPQLFLTFLALLVLTCPIPGIAPRLFQRQDPWRLFKGGGSASRDGAPDRQKGRLLPSA